MLWMLTVWSSALLASEAFFDNLTVEQEFMTGVDTDKVPPMELEHTIFVNNNFYLKRVTSRDGAC